MIPGSDNHHTGYDDIVIVVDKPEGIYYETLSGAQSLAQSLGFQRPLTIDEVRYRFQVNGKDLIHSQSMSDATVYRIIETDKGLD